MNGLWILFLLVPIMASIRPGIGWMQSVTGTPMVCTWITGEDFSYRDWVVRAFNDNLPFDEFITWQLAGDLLPDPTLDQKIATGFVRMNPSTAEGGPSRQSFRPRTISIGWKAWVLPCSACLWFGEVSYAQVRPNNPYRILSTSGFFQ